MKVTFTIFVLVIMMFPIHATAQEDIPPVGFLNTTEIVRLLEFENFDDLHSLENSDGERVKPLYANVPFLAETYKLGKYGHYDEEGLTDTADYSVKDHSLCLTWTWTDNEKLEIFNGREYCFYIEQLANCYLAQHKSRFARPVKKIRTNTIIFLKFGDKPECTPKIS